MHTAPSAPPPHVVSWNLTARCNLRCGHCYLDATTRAAPDGELDTETCLEVASELTSWNPALLLIMTGGEPLLRPDLERISRHAADRGAMVVIGTNGCALTPERARSLVDAGVGGVGVSIDSATDRGHDAFRGVAGARRQAIAGMRNALAAGLQVVVQTTVTRTSRGELAEIAALAHREGARAFNAFFLVCTGRASKLTDLDPTSYEGACIELRRIERRYEGRMLVSPKCAPHYRRIVSEAEGNDAPVRSFDHGCPAGIEYLRIGPMGRLTPCPYMPITVGRVGEVAIEELWNDSETLRSLRMRQLGGRCGACALRETCGGCRARAYAVSEEVLAEDPICTSAVEAVGDAETELSKRSNYGGSACTSIPWTEEAKARLDRIPSALRRLIASRVEAAARDAGETLVTVERMREVRRGFLHHVRGA